MLGRTHILSSLALMHTGLIGYTMYANRDVTESGKEEYLQVFGLSIGKPMSIMEYGLMVAAVGFFILWLLHIGGHWRIRTTHLVLMAVSLILLRFTVGESYSFTITMVILCFALGTVLPDIDSNTSTIGKYIAPISSFIPHRTITHTIWAALLIAGIAWYFESIYLLALALGYTAHIVEDSFSEQGIHWFYPVPSFRRKRRLPFTYETGGVAESMMFYAAIGVHTLCAVFVIWSSLGQV
ncbi:metal-dependent hydrolase [Virgibacillus sp. AGTR]|uniref:metal-dependent hydrolase n=1 Tax=Virgibacillus sp. AGTR TaxID=2812055 RepID=UPI001D162B14|nr:metal-dependent hydrolase [Virgibacillus sp. AGTR]MCC2248950.1 metal-dependent hydrolase [Virgibacillus sp. AGTR]